jgi:hypothetical protein
MKKRFYTRLLLCVVAALSISLSVSAQAPANSLPALPECDAILYINTHRIIGEALPRILPADKYAEMKAGLEEIKRKSGIDLEGFESGVLALRFNKPITAPPDFVLVVRGTFNADALLSLARIGLQGKLREEKYGSKSISIFKLSDILGADQSKFLPPGISDMAATALDGGTLAVGNLSYVKATIDAESGEKRVSPELMALAMRDTSALISLAITIPQGLVGGLLPKEMQGNDEIFKIISGIENFYLSVGMNATEFPILASVRTASAEHARTLNGLVEMGLHAAASQIPDKKAQSLVDALKVTAEGSEVRVQIPIPQETLATLIREANKPKPEVKAKPADQPAAKAKPATRRKQSRAKKP